MTPASKLAQLSPDERIVRIRAEEARAERAEMRLAVYALSEFWGGCFYIALREAWRCECGHTFVEHCTTYTNNPVGTCFHDDADRHEPSRRCACRAFVARTPAVDSDSGAAVASLNTATEAT